MQKKFRFLFPILLSLFYVSAQAQQGNEWINFGQLYYRIPVGKDGIYRITKTDLEQAGFPVNLDPRRYQIFSKGIEQARLIAGQEDAIFNDGDYIEFYGKRNDGSLDQALYKIPGNQPHNLYPLYNDTTYYFLTFNPTTQGKRLQTFFETNTSSLPKESAQQTERLFLNTSSYSTGETVSGAIQLSTFNEGEGWSGPIVREGNFTDASITGLTNSIPASGLPNLQVQILGRSAGSHRAQIWVGANSASLRLLQTIDFAGFQPITANYNLQYSDISAGGNIVVRMQVLGVGGSDFISLSYARVTMPQSFSLAGLTERYITLYNNLADKSYLELENAPVNVRIYDVTNVNDVRQIGTQGTTTLTAIVDGTQIEQRKLFATTVINTINSNQIKRVSFRSLQNVSPDFLIITHRAFQRSAAGVTNPIRAYAAYRASEAGGRYDTLTVTVDQLYNQFTYGEATPLAIHRFLKFLESKKRPDYLFFIGRGLDIFNNYYRNPNNAAFAVFKDYVPSAGYPASDLYYSVGLNDPNTNEPAIPTGRLSVTSPEQVVFYLNKVIEQEALSPTQDWRKRILHLSGGIAAGEPAAFKSYMEDFASIAEEPFLGAEVKAIAKQSLEADKSINISEEVNDGLNLITFFGHSSTTTTDFDIGFVTDPVLGYNNKGKYPALLINGCNAGAFFNSSRVLFGEDWVNAADKGAIAFLAHSSFGFVSTLKRYSDIFYFVAFADPSLINKGIGDVQKFVSLRYLENVTPTLSNITQVQQMILLGDPAVKLFPADKPDYSIQNGDVTAQSEDGKQITNLTSTYQLRIITKNSGLALPNQYKLKVEHKEPDNTITDYSQQVAATFNRDTLFITIDNTKALSGTHEFIIKADDNEEIEELSESNNGFTYTLFIPRSGTKNLYPENFAIVNQTNIDFVFQSANLLDSLRSYVLEIDTSYQFNSTYKKQFTIREQLLANKDFSILTTDTLTYYWRTKLKFPAPNETSDWENSSFTFIQNETNGWGQFQFGQFINNQLNQLELNEGARRIDLEETQTPVLIKTFGDNNPSPFTDVSFKIEGVEYNLSTQGQPCRDNTINLVAFNRTNNIPYAGIPFNFQDPRTCGREPQVIVSFTFSEVFNNGVNDLVDYVNRIAAGDSVVLFTIGNPQVKSYPSQVWTALQNLGISQTQLNAYNNGEPLVIFGRKGASSNGATIYTSTLSSPIEQELIVNTQVTARKPLGEMKWRNIGRSSSWEIFKSKWTLLDQDEKTLTIFTNDKQGVSNVFISDATAEEDLTSVDASIIPTLDLSFQGRDNVNLTAPQLQFWLATGENLPEGILQLKEFKTKSETDLTDIQEGDSILLSFSFKNISNKNFVGTIPVRISIFNKNSNLVVDKSLSIQTLPIGEEEIVSFRFSTINLSGWNDLRIIVNENEIVAERYLENNNISVTDAFFVIEDAFSPVLDVTFDGRRLRNGDFVSKNPEIKTVIVDENSLINKKDTLGIQLFLTKPCTGCQADRIYFKRPDISWTPATENENFSILFKPFLQEKGVYTFQVTAADAKGNNTGIEPYLITFEVTDQAGIEIAEPYPMPAQNYIVFKSIIKEEIDNQVSFIKLYDTTGKLILQYDLANHQFFVGTNLIRLDLPAITGVLVYEFSCLGKVKRGRIVLIP